MPPFNLQGHRGARGRRPENTLPSFEAAWDALATSVETDLHLTADGVVVICHDAFVSGKLFRRLDGGPVTPALLRQLTLAELRQFVADRNPEPERFPDQRADPTPLSERFAAGRGLPSPYAVPTLDELLAFAAACASDPAKSAAQRAAAAATVFDLEIKRVPGRPETMGDPLDDESGGLLERSLVESVRHAGVVGRTLVRSFDHRCARAVKRLEPTLATGILIANTAPVDPVALVRAAGATTYCPDIHFVDERQIRQCHDAGLAVLPWTANDPADWARLTGWGVDGVTTDFPEALAEWLCDRGIVFAAG
jgi:glycerophosphoryl diester phosphodiesterase